MEILKFQIFLKTFFQSFLSQTNFLIYFFKSWDAYFRNNSYSAPPSLAPVPRNHMSASQYLGSSLPGSGGGASHMSGRVDDKLIDDHLAVQAIIRSYQVNGNGFQSSYLAFDLA